MKNFIRTYCSLISLLFVSCLFPETGLNCAKAEVADSIGSIQEIKNLTSIHLVKDTSATKTVDASTILAPDTTKAVLKDSISLLRYKPDPKKALWYSALCPGLGQLYNRRYWKLPIVGAAVVGVVYAIGWNQKYYNAYTNAYRDISDNDPNTKSYLNLNLLPTGNYDTSQLTTVLKNRQQIFRRYRDLSFIGAVGVYLFCLIDAYVDAQLYDFDISPDLSLQLPSVHKGSGIGGGGGIELSLAFHF